MFDPKMLLNQVMGAGLAQNGKLPSALGGIVSRLSQPGSPAPSGASFTGSAGNVLATGRDYLERNAGALGTGALAGGLAGLLLGSKAGRKLGGSALKLGGLAVVGGLAYKAYRDWQAGQAPAPAPEHNGTPLVPLPPQGSAFDHPDDDQRALLFVRAMIAAAKADGTVDKDEAERITGELDKAGLGAEARTFLVTELTRPTDYDALAAGARTPEDAAEIYAASLLAITVDTEAERRHLDTLAARLGLDPALKAHLDTVVGAVGRG